eukprot:scaffold26041_cov19-Tisochrysis_lutea.AAC.1
MRPVLCHRPFEMHGGPFSHDILQCKRIEAQEMYRKLIVSSALETGSSGFSMRESEVQVLKNPTNQLSHEVQTDLLYEDSTYADTPAGTHRIFTGRALNAANHGIAHIREETTQRVCMTATPTLIHSNCNREAPYAFPGKVHI